MSRLCLLVFVLSWVGADAAWGDVLWNGAGTSGDFELGGNYAGGAPPANDATTDVVGFWRDPVSSASYAITGNMPTLTQSRSVKGLYLRPTAGGIPFTLGGADFTLTVGSAGIYTNNNATNTIQPSLDLNGGTPLFASWSRPMAVTGTVSNGGIITQGDSALYLTGANSFALGTTLGSTAGVRIGNDLALGTGPVNVAVAAAIDADNLRPYVVANPLFLLNNPTFGSSGLGGQNVRLTGTVTLLGDRTITVTSSGNTAVFALDGVVTDQGGGYKLVKAGASTLVLRGTNTFSGGVDLNTTSSGSILAVGNDNALGSGTLTIVGGTGSTAYGYAPTFRSDSTTPRRIANNVMLGDAIRFGSTTSSGKITLAGAVTLTAGLKLMVYSDTEICGNLSGSLPLVRGYANNQSVGTDGVTLTLSGSNSDYSGEITINQGVLRAASANALGSGLLRLSSTSVGTGYGGILELAAGDFTRSLGTGANQVSFGGNDCGFAAVGTARYVNLNNDMSTILWNSSTVNPEFLKAKRLILSSTSADAPIDFRNPINLNGVRRSFLVYDNPNSGTDLAIVSGPIVSGTTSVGIIKEGPGTLALTGTNTFTDLVEINGALREASQWALGGQITGNQPTIRFGAAGGVLELGYTNFNRALGGSAKQINMQNSTPGCGFAAYDATRTVNIGNNLGLLTWNVTASFLKSDAYLMLGSVTANDVLDFQNPIELGASGTTRTIKAVDNLFSTNDRGRMSGTISGGGNLNITGNGVLELAADNTYTGATNVTGATLLVTGTIGSTSQVTVTGGKLGGTGVISGPVVLTGATLSPGMSAGALATGNLTLDSTSSLVMELSGTSAGSFDQVKVNGDINLGSSLLALALGYAPAANDSLTILDNLGANPVTGAFAGLAQSATFTLAYAAHDYTFQISYTGGSGNDVVLTALAPPVTDIPGDINRDHIVDQADYTVWYNHYGQTPATWSDGDVTGDNIVDQADYTVWYNHYGQTGGNVPEPMTLTLLAAGMAGILRRRRCGSDVLECPTARKEHDD